MIEGFGDALDGHFDAADQLSRYALRTASEHFEAERAEKGAIDSSEAFENRRDRVREVIRSDFGGLPERPTDPSVETVDVDRRDGYAVESLTYQSIPDFHVTANCYVPDGEGPHPAVLFLAGHVTSPRGDPENQRACIELARNGFVVLTFDPIGQGERKQYLDAEGEPIFTGSGGVFSHCHAGQKCFYAGANLARYLVHDARVALDVLERRADVDDDRIGVTGTSGGGVQTQYLALFDDRVDVAAPCCSVTERSEWLETGKRIDAEQVIRGAIPRGINYDDLIVAMAPRPVCVGAAASDGYFPIEGVRETIDRVRDVYALYDAEENVDLHVTDAGHCSVYELREGVFEFLCERLAAGAYEPLEDVQPVDPSELQCTAPGSVVEAYSDERTVDDLIAEYAESEHAGGPSTQQRASDDDEAIEQLGARLVERFDLDRNRTPLDPRTTARSDHDGLDVERVWFKTERDPSIVVAGVLVSDPDADPMTPAVVLYEDGTEELPDRTEDLAALAREHGAAFAFDPRGVGAVRNREIPIPAWVEEYDGVYGTEFKLAYDALLLGDSLLAMRTFDVLRAVEFVHSEIGGDRITLVGEGLGAYHACFAAGAAEAVDRVELRDLGPSFRERTTGDDVPYDPSLTAYDVPGDSDVPAVLQALNRQGVSVDRSNTDR